MRDDYVLGHSSHEYERLRHQAQVLDPATRRVFQSIGLQPGWTCLDVGCGSGESMRLMGEFVGSSGEVTGLDRDGKAGSEAIERLRASGANQFRFIETNIETVDHVSGAPFDMTFARLALLFVRDPVAVLRKMYRWTKPGGYIVIQDYHVRTINLHPRLDACSELLRVIIATCEQSGQDMEFAFKLPAYFVDAGIGVPDGTDIHLPLTSLGPWMAMFQAVCRSLLPKAIELGVTTEARMQKVFHRLQQAQSDGRYYSALWPLMIGVWKCKPL